MSQLSSKCPSIALYFLVVGQRKLKNVFFLGPWTKCFRQEQESLPLLILISGVGNKVFFYYYLSLS